MEGGALAPPSSFLSPCSPGLANVLITGGDRMERLRVAREHHAASRLGRGPFVAIRADQSDLPGALILEITRSAGGHDTSLRRAEGGTLFLDEIERMDLDAQRLFLEFLCRARAEGAHDGGWAGRIAAGTSANTRSLVSAGRLLEELLDALDKVRTSPVRPAKGGSR
jgi:DNA-binding NtrC family response regulator